MTNQLNEFKSHYKDLKELKHYLNKNLIDDINRDLLYQGFSDYDEITGRCKDYLIDEGSLFRFYKKSNYDIERCYMLIRNHLILRLKSNLDRLELPFLINYSINDNDQPLIYNLRNIKDLNGNLVLVITLSKVLRKSYYYDNNNDSKDSNDDDDDDDDPLDDVKECILYSWELSRQLLMKNHSNHLDFIAVIDVSNSTIENLHYDLVKFFIDIISNHYPHICKQILIVNSKLWSNTLWTMTKKVLPNKIVNRIKFVDRKELDKYFNLEELPKHLGGNKIYNNVDEYAINQLEGIVNEDKELYFTAKSTPIISRNNSNKNIQRPNIVNQIPSQSFQLNLKTNRINTNNNEHTEKVKEVKEVKEVKDYNKQIRQWHLNKLNEKFIVMDKYNHLNPRYGYKVIYKLSNLNGSLIIQSKLKYVDLMITLIKLIYKKYNNRLKILAIVILILIRRKFLL